MKKEIIDRFLAVLAMFLLTFIFAAVAVHYDVFAASFSSQPVGLSEMVAVLVGILLVFCLACFFFPPLIFYPFVIFFVIMEEWNWKRHFYNVALFLLSGAFIYFAVNLVAIYELLSGEIVKEQATLGGCLAVIYAWVILFGTLYSFYRLSGFDDILKISAEVFAKDEDKAQKS